MTRIWLDGPHMSGGLLPSDCEGTDMRYLVREVKVVRNIKQHALGVHICAVINVMNICSTQAFVLFVVIKAEQQNSPFKTKVRCMMNNKEKSILHSWPNGQITRYLQYLNFDNKRH